MDDVIRIHDQFYILATSSRVDDRTRVLKDGDSFAVFDRHGDIHPLGLGEYGLFHDGTRHLSRLEVDFGGERTLLLSSTIREDNAALAVDLANPDLREGEKIVVPADTVHLFRSAFLWKGRLYVRLRVHNFALQPVTVPLRLRFEADFLDIFEVRGVSRKRRGTRLPPVRPSVSDNLRLRYRGLDGVIRATQLHFQPAADRLTPEQADYRLGLEPKAETDLFLTITCETGRVGTPSPEHSYETAFRMARQASSAAQKQRVHLLSSNEQLNDWLHRSFADLQMMLTETPHGPYPYAGIPWFSTAFGRDGLVTALETLWIDPAIARGVLRFLAAMQATESDPIRDAEPGKILHEMRGGEMAALGEIPFGRYYGTVDATPLFVVLAGAYYERTGDLELLERIWPNLEAALRWIDEHGDADGDGFVEYHRRTSEGLANQGWKDSQDSVFHADGSLAEGPIALCEVQAYVYAAQQAAAALALALGDTARAEMLRDKAAQLQKRFDEVFWSEELSSYVLGLDGEKRSCRVRTSNAGHALFGGIARPERAERLALTLLSDDLFSGWGVRTLAVSEVRFNPMSYHNGSVWPHDNALIALGLSRYGLKEAALRILSGLFDASLFMDLHRLPELFCGFTRRRGVGPTLYPVACSPQSWAVGAPFLLLQSCLGLQIDAPAREIRFTNPVLPPSLEELVVSGLAVGDASVDLTLRRRGETVAVNVARRHGNVDVLVQI